MPLASYDEGISAKDLEAGISDVSTDHSTSSSEASSDDELMSNQASGPILVPVPREDAGHENLAGFLESNGTTLVVLNVPRKYTLPVLLDEIVAAGFHPHRDLCFLHMPMIPKANVNFGYFVISFTDIPIMNTFISSFDGRRMWLSKHEALSVRRYMPPPGLELSRHSVSDDTNRLTIRAPAGFSHALDSVDDAVPRQYTESTFHEIDDRKAEPLHDISINTKLKERCEVNDDADMGIFTNNMSSTVPCAEPFGAMQAHALPCTLLNPFYGCVSLPVQVPGCTDLRLQAQIAQQFHKTKLCAFFRKGNCAYGAHCAYAHSRTELQRKPDLTKTQLCSNFFRQGRFDQACRFAHGYDELRSSDDVYKL